MDGSLGRDITNTLTGCFIMAIGLAMILGAVAMWAVPKLWNAAKPRFTTSPNKTVQVPPDSGILSLEASCSHCFLSRSSS